MGDSRWSQGAQNLSLSPWRALQEVRGLRAVWEDLGGSKEVSHSPLRIRAGLHGAGDVKASGRPLRSITGLPRASEDNRTL